MGRWGLLRACCAAPSRTYLDQTFAERVRLLLALCFHSAPLSFDLGVQEEPPPRVQPVVGPAHSWRLQVSKATSCQPIAQMPHAGPVGALPESRRAASCAARKGVTAGALIFLGFRSLLQLARPKGLFVLSGEVSAEGRATSRGSTPPLWFSGRMPALLGTRWAC